MLRVVCLSLAALSLGCASTTKYSLSPAEPQWREGYWCVHACEQNRKNRDYFACLEKCPGVRTGDGECTSYEKPPHGFCESKHEKGAAAELIGGSLALLLAVAGVYGAVTR
jgi:hypothetical protein